MIRQRLPQQLCGAALEIFLDDEGICKRCRKLYMGHDVLLDAQQAQALQEYNIAVNVIPDYYYKELEG